MSNGAGALEQVGAACFGIVVGYITYRTLVRASDKTAISDLAAVVGAIGGAAVTGLFAPGTSLFAWYSIGLLVGMAVFFVIFGMINGRKQLGSIMSIRPDVLSGGRNGARSPSRPQG